ncbi:hypothetical protein [Bradyrhizobium sp. SZCCHNS1012]|uniref:hypothetical protein n=1 Tax=Bradyrhizobium sp. SZCCHNS1012 TaxID=3057297 RepID=UPI002915E436|nr:hypothetical protein [Bradyrhizobium sp. SZCCHNS1012]
MTTIDIKKLAEQISLEHRGRVWQFEQRGSSFFITAFDRSLPGREYRADAILDQRLLTDPESARTELVNALRTASHMLDIDLSAEPA